MFILSIINAAIILLVNSLRIEDAIAAFHSSDFEAVFWISVFLAAVDALAILIILDRPYSKYLYPIELLLYFSYLHFSGIQFQRYDAHFNEWFETAKSDAAPVALPSSGENQIIGPVKRYAEFKIPGQNLIMRAENEGFGGFKHIVRIVGRLRGNGKNARDAKLRHVRYGKFLRARVHGGRGRLRAMRVGDTGV